ncbi:uncharacterized protein LOC106672042 [Cimex lectularius]|uniref:MGA conserved domain-containing protein n=1 Tax=Cimex lectularius TaxID=79782 RepID=A0A8I6S692_CIMLE|nr:uncharacterized protein LOC106672042 [Cimex lectularius]XP_014258624.1 uncharacterized protein LOC106672042 [Cimex lectularius]XP_024085255.1 uncharacterized protein LOC106672042 [Cimex lectularius]
MECSYLVQNPAVMKGDEATCVFPECFVETVMDEDKDEPEASCSITPLRSYLPPPENDCNEQCSITKLKTPQVVRPFFSRIVLTENEDDLSPKHELPREKPQIEDILPNNKSLKQLFQDVYYKNISKDPFLKGLCKEETINNEFPFKSKTLSDYLQNNTKLNVSFDIPMLYAYEKSPPRPAVKASIQTFINNGPVSSERIAAPSTSISVEKEYDKKPFGTIKKLRIPFHIKRKTEFEGKQKESRNNVEYKRFNKTQPKSSDSQLNKYSNKTIKSETVLSDDDRLLMQKYNLLQIPFIYKCNRKNGKKCNENPKKFRLSLVLNIGYKRPLLDELEANFILKPEETIVSPLSAVIAASAVTKPFTKKTLTRVVVPVLPGSEIYSKSSQALKLFNVLSYDCKEINENVARTVSDLVDFVVRQDDFLPIEYDTDVPHFEDAVKEDIEETDADNYVCNKEFCVKGCVCDSLKGKVDIKHCDNIDCVFGCMCNELRRRTLRNAQLNDFKDKVSEEMVNGKVRRGSKTPQRYRDYVRNFSLVNMKSLDDKKSSNDPDYKVSIPSLKKFKMEMPEKNRAPKLLGDSEVPGMEWQLFKPVKEQIEDRRFKFCSGKIKERQTLGDIFIWCTLHSKYNCLCPNPVAMFKHNIMIWKPTSEVRYLANKVMFKIMLDSNSGFDKEVVPFDLQNNCSRTFKGTIIDFSARNSDLIFKKKRQYELKHNILCYSNSYVKCKPYLMLDKGLTVPPLPCEDSALKPNNMQIINFHSKRTDEEIDFVDVEEISKEIVDDIDDEPEITIFEEKEDVIDLTEENDINETPSEPVADDVKEKLLTKESFEEPENMPSARRSLPSHGFLCLTPGIGFLEVDNSNNKITIQHPKTLASCKTFNSIEEANDWINVLFKSHFSFEPPSFNLQWVVVTQGVLKLKKSKPFQTDLFNNPSVVITKNGPVIQKGAKRKQEELD